MTVPDRGSPATPSTRAPRRPSSRWCHPSRRSRLGRRSSPRSRREPRGAGRARWPAMRWPEPRGAPRAELGPAPPSDHQPPSRRLRQVHGKRTSAPGRAPRSEWRGEPRVPLTHELGRVASPGNRSIRFGRRARPPSLPAGHRLAARRGPAPRMGPDPDAPGRRGLQLQRPAPNEGGVRSVLARRRTPPPQGEEVRTGGGNRTQRAVLLPERALQAGQGLLRAPVPVARGG